MKRLMIASVLLFAFSSLAQAQMAGDCPNCGKTAGMQHGMMMAEGQQMPMGMMNMQMMKHMMGHGMMMQEMMQMMMDMMKMQQKMMAGKMNPAERKDMMAEMNRMRDRLEKMMSDMRGMMMKGMTEPPVQPGKEEPKKEEAPKGDEHGH